jgi:hypothetical protein
MEESIMRSWTEFFEKKPFGAFFVGVIAFDTFVPFAMHDWPVLVVPVFKRDRVSAHH